MGVSLGARVLKKIRRDNQKSETVHFVQESGQSFANQDSRSDVKLRNRPDPYAFVQFNPVVISSGALRKTAEQGVQGLRTAHEKADVGRPQGTQGPALILRVFNRCRVINEPHFVQRNRPPQ